MGWCIHKIIFQTNFFSKNTDLNIQNICAKINKKLEGIFYEITKIIKLNKTGN